MNTKTLIIIIICFSLVYSTTMGKDMTTGHSTFLLEEVSSGQKIITWNPLYLFSKNV